MGKKKGKGRSGGVGQSSQKQEDEATAGQQQDRHTEDAAIAEVSEAEITPEDQTETHTLAQESATNTHDKKDTTADAVPTSEQDEAIRDADEAETATTRGADHENPVEETTAATTVASDASGKAELNQPDIVLPTEPVSTAFLEHVHQTTDVLQAQLKEISDAQKDLLESVQAEAGAINIDSVVLQVMSMLPSYTDKLENIRKGIHTLHDRSQKLKRRMDKLVDKRNKAELAKIAARKREEARVAMLSAQPAPHVDATSPQPSAADTSKPVESSSSDEAAKGSANVDGTTSPDAGSGSDASAVVAPLQPVQRIKKSKQRRSKADVSSLLQ